MWVASSTGIYNQGQNTDFTNIRANYVLTAVTAPSRGEGDFFAPRAALLEDEIYGFRFLPPISLV